MAVSSDPDERRTDDRSPGLGMYHVTVVPTNLERDEDDADRA